MSGAEAPPRREPARDRRRALRVGPRAGMPRPSTPSRATRQAGRMRRIDDDHRRKHQQNNPLRDDTSLGPGCRCDFAWRRPYVAIQRPRDSSRSPHGLQRRGEDPGRLHPGGRVGGEETAGDLGAEQGSASIIAPPGTGRSRPRPRRAAASRSPAGWRSLISPKVTTKRTSVASGTMSRPAATGRRSVPSSAIGLLLGTATSTMRTT
jgi:hypothetical protein